MNTTIDSNPTSFDRDSSSITFAVDDVKPNLSTTRKKPFMNRLSDRSERKFLAVPITTQKCLMVGTTDSLLRFSAHSANIVI